MQMLGSVLWFVVIVAAIPLVLWLVKRSPLGARLGTAAPPGVMRNVAALPLSGSQRVVTVEVGEGDDRTWLVLGVTPQSITTLHRMVPQRDAPEEAPPAVTSFADLLGKLRPRGVVGKADPS